MVTQTIKIKNGAITLPKELRKKWGRGEVFIKTYRDKIIIEKPRTNELIFDKGTEQKLRSLGKKISNRDIKEAIRWVRRKE